MFSGVLASPRLLGPANCPSDRRRPDLHDDRLSTCASDHFLSIEYLGMKKALLYEQKNMYRNREVSWR
jgi:hypothetical protein